jgi:hypothetical protein
MERYFDAFLYLANWGTREFMLRLPRRLLDPETARRYCRGDSATVKATGDFTILAFHSDTEDPEDFYDGSEWLASLIPLRSDLAAGDHRILYLAWLLCVRNGEVDEDEPEPPIPPGLSKLTRGLRAFADFLRIDRDLITAAAELSPAPEAEPTRQELGRWIAELSTPEKEELLLRVATGEERQVHSEIRQRFRRSHSSADGAGPPARTAGDLLEAAKRAAAERRRRELRRREQERVRHEREEAEARERRLVGLAGREPEAWRQVDQLIESRHQTAYDEAVQLLRDLLELGAREGQAPEVEERIERLRREHARKWSFVRRLDQAGLAVEESRGAG